MALIRDAVCTHAGEGANRDRGGRPKKVAARHAHAPSIYSGEGSRVQGSRFKRFSMTLLEELEWRGMVSEATDGVREAFASERVTAYIGFDPTASSLHIGNLLT